MAEAEQVALKVLQLDNKASALGSVRLGDPAGHSAGTGPRSCDQRDLETGDADVVLRGAEALIGENLICRRLHSVERTFFASAE
ncbi:MAG: hypothetical protein AAFR17_02205 [Pseudomonadota bacterium]